MRYHVRKITRQPGKRDSWVTGNLTTSDGVITDTTPAWVEWVGRPLSDLLLRMGSENFRVYVVDDAKQWHALPNPFFGD